MKNNIVGKQVVVTRGVMSIMQDNKRFSQEVTNAFCRFCGADWGDMCEEDKQMNNNALNGSDRIVAKYCLSEDNIYIITECDRSVTTILLCDEY